MNPKFSKRTLRTSLLAGAALGLSGANLFADDATPAKATLTSDAFPTSDSYIKISGQAASIKGDDSAFAKRLHQPEKGGAGIEDYHLIKSLPKDYSMVVDGHALSGPEDYLGQFVVSKNEVGALEVGYKSFRTFYDGVGGFFPLNNQWLPLINQDLHTDRRKFWAKATINLPDLPVLTLSYTNEIRDGKKDSTIWGDTDLTGLPFALAPNPISAVRKIVPSYLDLDEHHEVLEASIKHTIGKTTIQLTALNDRTDNLDTRYVTRFPGESIPWAISRLSTSSNSVTGRSPQNIAKAAAPATSWNNQVDLQQSDGIKTRTSAVIGKIDSALTDKITVHVGGSYQLMHSDIASNRPLVTSTPTSTGAVPVTTATFTNLVGSSRIKRFTGSTSIDYDITKDIFASVGYRYEEEFIKAKDTYSVIAASGTPATTLTTTPRKAWSKLNQDSSTPVAELRYSGIKNLSLYATGSKRDLDGEEKNTSPHNPLTSLNGALVNNNLSEDHGNYKVGGNWRACSALTLRAEGFQKHHQFESAGFGLNLGEYYLVDSQFKGVKLTAIVKPIATLSFTTRYVAQRGELQVTGEDKFDSGDVKNHSISETIDWAPSKAVYVQLNGSLVFNTISTIYPRAGSTIATVNGSGVTTASSYDVNKVLQNGDSNYRTGNAIIGFVAAKNTDIQLQYTYYRSNNSDASLAAFTQPYGADSRDSMVTVGIKHKISDTIIFNAKVGYIDSVSNATGGFTNYHGPLGYLSMDFAL
jgi:hypothetical protein